MSATVESPVLVTDATDEVTAQLHNTGGRRQLKNRVATLLMVLAFVVAVVPLGFVIVDVVQQGAKVMSVEFLTSDIPTSTASQDLSVAQANKYRKTQIQPTQESSVTLGMGPAIVGTLLTTAAAAAMAIPLGVLGAIYLNEYGKKNRLASFIRFMTDVMTGVPSVIMGVFIYTVWVLRFGVAGKTAFAGALALACLMLPIVVRSSEEMLRLVPDSLREASAALGVRTWRTTWSVVLPAALPGITSGSMLAVARAAGETAPVLFTLGITSTVNWQLFHGSNTTLSYQIYSQATNGGAASTSLAWGAALTLITVVLVLTLGARIIASRFTVR